MKKYRGLETPQQPDPDAFLANILRKGTPRRVHHIELFQDAEVADAIVRRYGLMDDVPREDPNYERKKHIVVQRFCGFDYASAALLRLDLSLFKTTVEDTAALKRASGRAFQDEHKGPIMSWEDFEKYPWPDPNAPEAGAELQWFQENTPDDMFIIARGTGHFAEYLGWLMGYETLCYALFDRRDLVRAIADRLLEFYRAGLARILEFSRVKVIFASDDMGFKTGPLISPADMREFVIPGHKMLAEMAHKAGRPYLLHSCGNLSTIIGDLVHDVKIDAKHSFEDTIEDVRQAKKTYGREVALLGGMDVDFLCRSDEAAIRRRVRETLDECMPGGGYCLGTGNTVANFIPLDNYLAMLDEGRLYGE
jgi:uroporphyrinogen decarboxylase